MMHPSMEGPSETRWAATGRRCGIPSHSPRDIPLLEATTHFQRGEPSERPRCLHRNVFSSLDIPWRLRAAPPSPIAAAFPAHRRSEQPQTPTNLTPKHLWLSEMPFVASAWLQQEINVSTIFIGSCSNRLQRTDCVLQAPPPWPHENQILRSK